MAQKKTKIEQLQLLIRLVTDIADGIYVMGAGSGSRDYQLLPRKGLKGASDGKMV